MTDFARYLPRLCRWPALAIGVGLAWGLTWWRAEDATNELAALWLLRFVAAVVAVAATFALDDPSFDVTRSTIGSRRLLMPMRVSVTGSVVVVGMAPAAVMVGGELTTRTWWGLTLEVIAVLAVLCAVHVLMQQRLRFSEPAQFLVFVVLLFGLYEQVTVGRWPLLAAPGAGWNDAHVRWLAVAVVAVGVLLWQLRDPANGRAHALTGLRRGVASRGEQSPSRDRQVQRALR